MTRKKRMIALGFVESFLFEGRGGWLQLFIIAVAHYIVVEAIHAVYCVFRGLVLDEYLCWQSFLPFYGR